MEKKDTDTVIKNIKQRIQILLDNGELERRKAMPFHVFCRIVISEMPDVARGPHYNYNLIVAKKGHLIDSRVQLQGNTLFKKYTALGKDLMAVQRPTATWSGPSSVFPHGIARTKTNRVVVLVFGLGPKHNSIVATEVAEMCDPSLSREW